MILKVHGKKGQPAGVATIGDATFKVALGKNGVIPEAQKREGDMCTPLGTYQVLYGLYRPDKMQPPEDKAFPWKPFSPQMGWCDAPTDAAYNQPVPVGYGASHEVMWRKDSAYDRVLVLNHNTPAKQGFGSAIFIHYLHPNKAYTAGCVALSPLHFDLMLYLGVEGVEISEAL